jgi:hypothetical protein
VDVWIVLGVYSFEFRMKSFIAGAGEAGIAFGDLDEGISGMEVGVVAAVLGISFACGEKVSFWTKRRKGSVYPKCSVPEREGPTPAPSSFS